jgi:hypothetical protein
MTSLIIQGQPIATFETQLDSWNDAIAKAYARPKFTRSRAADRWTFNEYKRQWRERGSQLATEFLDSLWWMTLDTPYLVRKRAMVIIKVCRGTERTYDVHNAYCKALFDGFSDAGIWRDDSWMYVPWVLYGWVHMDDFEGSFFGDNTFLIEVHELEHVRFNGREYILPDWSGYVPKERSLSNST